MAGQIARRAFALGALLALLALLALGVGAALAAEKLEAPVSVPVKGTVTMLELGAKTCIPCRMMVPVLEQARKDYKGRAAVVSIDVSEEPAQARRFNIRAIPTQIFFDAAGREVSRHTGYMDPGAVAAQLNKMLAK